MAVDGIDAGTSADSCETQSPFHDNVSHVETCAIDSSMSSKHALHTLWVYTISSGKWAQRKTLPSFSFAEDYWAQTASISPPSSLTVGTSLYLFRAGIEPLWEALPHGGTWAITIEQMDAHVLDESWSDLSLGAIGETLCVEVDDVCGCEVSVRRKNVKLAVWCRVCGSRADLIGSRLRELLPRMPPEAAWEFVPFTTKRRELAVRRSCKGPASPSAPTVPG
jgi:hypothetical protein